MDGDVKDDRNSDELFDDLDAFFNAAANADPGAMRQAAASVTSAAGDLPTAKPVTGSYPKSGTQTSGKDPSPAPGSSETNATTYDDVPFLDGKFIAIEPVNTPDGQNSGQPFILIPAHIHSFLPWWGWAAILASLIMLVAGVMLMPVLSLNRLTIRLGEGNHAQAQAAMRQLALSGDGRTVNKLYDMASSPGSGITARLRAVDTLSLIPAPDADHALLRLELAGNTDERVREAAIAARKQRVLNRERVRYR